MTIAEMLKIAKDKYIKEIEEIQKLCTEDEDKIKVLESLGRVNNYLINDYKKISLLNYYIRTELIDYGMRYSKLSYETIIDWIDTVAKKEILGKIDETGYVYVLKEYFGDEDIDTEEHIDQYIVESKKQIARLFVENNCYAFILDW